MFWPVLHTSRPRWPLSWGLVALLVGLCQLSSSAFSAQASERVRLESHRWMITIDPASLGVEAQPRGKTRVQLATPRQTLSRAENLVRSEHHASWNLPDEALSVTVVLED